MNTGKRFEFNFKNSVPEDVFFYRLRDGSSAWGGNEKVRFQQTNMCDVIMFDGNLFYTLELKSVKGKSLPISNIKKHQIKDLLKSREYKNVVSGLVIDFNVIDKCYYIDINYIYKFILLDSRKSISIDYCEEKGIEISVKRLRTNKKYDINSFINNIRKCELN